MKLKTLKDIDTIGTDTLKWINSNKLRQEAIKWVKFYVDKHRQGVYPVEAFINFFNLTEEDLK